MELITLTWYVKLVLRVQEASDLVKNCKRIVELMHKSTPAHYNFVENQGALGMAKKKLVQENCTRWWSILAMFESIVENMIPLLGTLGEVRRQELVISTKQEKEMEAIIVLMKPFKAAGDLLGSEKEPTVSKILPTFEGLKNKL